MDEIVKDAIAKWPNVPAVYGWLSLDRRGEWLIKGDRISNPIVAGFINRNYEHDDSGRWFFQNGPQRVYVALSCAPFIYRIEKDPAADAPMRIETHTGKIASRLQSAWIDESGIVLLVTEYGVGMVDDRDLGRLLPYFTDASGVPLTEDAVAAAIERRPSGDISGLHVRHRDQIVPVRAVAAENIAAQFGFVQRPVQPAGAQECN
jgi:hypothetical protein